MRHVLVVDDHRGFVDAAALVIEASPNLCLEAVAHDAATARALLATESVDLALIDVHLGVDDGIELANDYLAEGGAARIVLVSSTDRADLPLGRADERVGFLQKEQLSTMAIERMFEELTIET